jgi:hypothetical protein
MITAEPAGRCNRYLSTAEQRGEAQNKAGPDLPPGIGGGRSPRETVHQEADASDAHHGG